MSDNLYYYVMGKTVPSDAMRSFTRKGGFSGTDINSMWRIKMLTEMFGPVGIGWYYEIVDRRVERYQETDEVKVYVDMALYIRNPETGEWSKPILGTGGNDAIVTRGGTKAANDECYKMATTDAFGQCCKWLGIGADVYWQSDRTKYTIDEDGSVDAHVPTQEEIRAENRAKATENAKADPFYAKAKQDDPGESAKARRSQVDIKSARISIAQVRDRQRDNEIVRGYIERYGARVTEWDDSKVIDCYLDLQDSGAIE